MGSLEANWLQVFKKKKKKLYRITIADVICLFNFESYADKFFQFLNKEHPNIKFTFE